MKRSKMIGTAAALAAFASLTVAPAAQAQCDEHGCNAPGNDPASVLLCLVTYDGPLKGIVSCFDPRP